MVLSLTSPQTGEHHTRLIMARFSGSNPESWILQAQRYFDFYQIREDDRIHISSFYFDADAAYWFGWMIRNHQLSTWSAFEKQLLQRFQAQHQDPLDLDTIDDRFLKCNKVEGESISDMDHTFAEIQNLLHQLLDSYTRKTPPSFSTSCETDSIGNLGVPLTTQVDPVSSAHKVFDEMLQTPLDDKNDDFKLIDDEVMTKESYIPCRVVLIDQMSKNINITISEISQPVDTEPFEEKNGFNCNEFHV